MLRYFTPLAVLATPVLADPPKVVTDIAPVHSLVAQVMGDLGTPALLLPPGTSPHDAALRPSDARGVQEADLVIWIGPALAPWMEEPLSTLAPDAAQLRLLEADGTHILTYRDFADFELVNAGEGAKAHDDHGHGHAEEKHEEHGHDEHKHDDHAHDEHGHDDHKHDEHAHDEHGHDDHKHDEHAHDEHGHAEGKHDEHAHDEHGEKGHDHAHGHSHGEPGGADPHAWLDPDNGTAWLDLIAETLSAADPENAATYAANAAAGKAAIDAAVAGAQSTLAPVKDTAFVVFHDAYQYFEESFDLTVAGSIALSDARPPGPRRLAEIRDVIDDGGIRCIFAETQFPSRLTEQVFEGTEARLSVLDPIGADLDLGPGLYPALIERLAEQIASCG